VILKVLQITIVNLITLIANYLVFFLCS